MRRTLEPIAMAARRNCEEGLALSREKGNSYGIQYSFMSLGIIAFAEGKYDLASKYLYECLALIREIGDRRVTFYVLYYLGNVAFAKGEYESAYGYFQDSLVMCREINAISYIVYILAGLAGISWVQFEQSTNSDKAQSLQNCVRMCGAINSLLVSTNIILRPPELGYYEKALETARSNLEEEVFNANLVASKEMSLDEAIEYALNISPFPILYHN